MKPRRGGTLDYWLWALVFLAVLVVVVELSRR